MNVDVLIRELPPYEGQYRSIRKRQSIKDLMSDILDKHKKEQANADKIAKYFWKGNAYNTGKFLFDFCKDNVDYKEEDTDNQSVKTIAGILVQGQGDCKHYAQLIVSICCALHRAGYPIKAKYRFAVYDNRPNEKGVKSGHVFAVIMDRGREIWCDPVLGTYDQRNPRYISHEDKVPPMGQVGRIGQVWDITGFGNNTTISGPHGGHHGGGHHGARGFRGGWGGGGYRGGGTTFVDEVFSPGYAFDTLTPAERLELEQRRRMNGMPNGQTLGSGLTITRDDRGTLLEQSTLGWIDMYYDRSQGIGKAKKAKKKHKGLHIKIQPGKLLKKFDPAHVASRNAFLGLLKLNAFHLGSQIFAKVAHNQAAHDKLFNFWKKAGGNTNKLSTALNQAVKVWNKHHAPHKISGYNDGLSGADLMMADPETVGIAPVAIPALLAAAAPMIAAIKGLLKSFGISAPEKGQVDAAEDEVIDKHNKATADKGDGNADINEDGSVTHEGGVTTKVTVDPKTGKQTLSYGADDDAGGADQEVVKTKTKTTTKEESQDDDGDDVETTTKTKSVSKVKSPDSGTGIAAYWDEFKGFVVEHKKYFIIGGAVLVSFFVIPKVYHAMVGPKKRGRR